VSATICADAASALDACGIYPGLARRLRAGDTSLLRMIVGVLERCEPSCEALPALRRALTVTSETID
jgi:hypothetical protein